MNPDESSEPLIAALERLAQVDDRGALSALRRSLAEDAIARAYPYVVPFIPRKSTPWLERTYLLVAGLFALHPANGSASLAMALRRVRDTTGSNSVEQRFVALLDAHPEDLAPHLRYAVSLVRSNEIPIDWRNLLRTVRNWNYESARRRWARDFWGGASPDEGETK
jgi:CRISPR system Cascade subunit CasB